MPDPGMTPTPPEEPDTTLQEETPQPPAPGEQEDELFPNTNGTK